jgi:hypothetical protein
VKCKTSALEKKLSRIRCFVDGQRQNIGTSALVDICRHFFIFASNGVEQDVKQVPMLPIGTSSAHRHFIGTWKNRVCPTTLLKGDIMSENTDDQSLPPREAVAHALIDHLLHIEEQVLALRQLLEEYCLREPTP